MLILFQSVPLPSLDVDRCPAIVILCSLSLDVCEVLERRFGSTFHKPFPSTLRSMPTILSANPSNLSSQLLTVILTAAFLATIAPQLDPSVCCGIGF